MNIVNSHVWENLDWTSNFPKKDKFSHELEKRCDTTAKEFKFVYFSRCSWSWCQFLRLSVSFNFLYFLFQLLLTGLGIMCLARRKNRYSVLVRIINFSSVLKYDPKFWPFRLCNYNYTFCNVCTSYTVYTIVIQNYKYSL